MLLYLAKINPLTTKYGFLQKNLKTLNKSANNRYNYIECEKHTPLQTDIISFSFFFGTQER